jgi:hypothetical protein
MDTALPDDAAIQALSLAVRRRTDIGRSRPGNEVRRIGPIDLDRI